jgi:hypothetical protein
MSFKNMSKKELLFKCEELFIKNYKSKNKNDLITMLETKVEETKVEETKVEETKVEETKVEETKVEETKVEEHEIIINFWNSINISKKLTQFERYKSMNSPECILKFISIGGGPGLGTMLENYARYKFDILNKRISGKNNTGYDHIINTTNSVIFVEQKSSSYWSNFDFKFQHIELKHKWNILLLCSIGYTNIFFYGLKRNTIMFLIKNGKITNQGDKSNNSTEGFWFNYKNVKDYLIELHTSEQLYNFVNE